MKTKLYLHEPGKYAMCGKYLNTCEMCGYTFDEALPYYTATKEDGTKLQICQVCGEMMIELDLDDSRERKYCPIGENCGEDTCPGVLAIPCVRCGIVQREYLDYVRNKRKEL